MEPILVVEIEEEIICMNPRLAPDTHFKYLILFGNFSINSFYNKVIIKLIRDIINEFFFIFA